MPTSVTQTEQITIDGDSGVQVKAEDSSVVLTSDLSFSATTGGLFYVTNYANVTFTGLQFESGSATYGGCIAVENSDVRIVDTTFTSCSAVGEN